MINPIQDIKDTIQDITAPKLTSGEKLINALKLKNFKYIWLQKIIDISIPIYVITVDSRRSTTFFGISKLKKLDSTVLKRTKQYGFNKILMKNPKFSVPIPLQYFSQKIGSNAIIIRRDLSGEYQFDSNLYEKEIKLRKLLVI